MQVFLSYARKDLDALRNALERYLEQLTNTLIAKGLGKLYRDTKDLEEHGIWREDLGRGIEASYAMVALVSTAWLNSKVCWQEYLHATRIAKIPVVPIIYDIPDPEPHIHPNFQQHWQEIRKDMEDRTNQQLVEWVKYRVGLYDRLLDLQNRDETAREASIGRLCDRIILPLQKLKPKGPGGGNGGVQREWPNVTKANMILQSNAVTVGASVPQFRLIMEPSEALGGLVTSKKIFYATSHAKTLGEWKVLLDLTEGDIERLSRSPPVHQPGYWGIEVISETEWRAMIEQVLREQGGLLGQPLSTIAGQFIGGFELPKLGNPELIVLQGSKRGDAIGHGSIYIADDNSTKRNKPAEVRWMRAKLRLVFRSSSKV